MASSSAFPGNAGSEDLRVLPQVIRSVRESFLSRANAAGDRNQTTGRATHQSASDHVQTG
ncbi:MAG: hypothetical protein VCE43_03735 [Myxococcota bacterium]